MAYSSKFDQSPMHLLLCNAAVALRTLLLFVIGGALLSMLIDTQTRFHLGDSETFLGAVWGVWLPTDRPWVYALLASGTMQFFGDLSALPKAQILIASGGVFVLACSLRAVWNTGRILFLLVLIPLFEPLSFWWARSVMSDVLATAMLSCVVAAVIWPHLPAVVRFVLVFVAVLATSFLRSVHTVPLLSAGVGTLLVFCVLGFLWPALRTARRDAAVVAAATICGVLAFVFLNTTALRQPRFALNHESSIFLLGAFSPLLKGREEMIPLSAERLSQLFPLDREHRLINTFAPRGLVEQIRAEHGANSEAVGLDLVKRVVLAAPWSVAGLWLANWWDYLNPRLVQLYHREARWSGATAYMQPNTLPPRLVERITGFGVWQGVRSDLPALPSYALSWLRAAGWISAITIAWLATLSLPLVLLTRLREEPAAWFAACLLTAMMAFMSLTVNAYVSRYLIAMLPPLMVLAAGASTLWRPRSAAGG